MLLKFIMLSYADSAIGLGRETPGDVGIGDPLAALRRQAPPSGDDPILPSVEATSMEERYLLEIPKTIQAIGPWLDNLVDNGLGDKHDTTVDQEFLEGTKTCLHAGIKTVLIQAIENGYDYHDLVHTLTLLRNLAYIAREVKAVESNACTSRQFGVALIAGAYHDSIVSGRLERTTVDYEHKSEVDPRSPQLEPQIHQIAVIDSKRQATDPRIPREDTPVGTFGSEDLSIDAAIAQMKMVGVFRDEDFKQVARCIRPTAPAFTADGGVIQPGLTSDLQFFERLVAMSDLADGGIQIEAIQDEVIRWFHIKSDCLFLEMNRNVLELINNHAAVERLTAAERAYFTGKIRDWARMQVGFTNSRAEQFATRDLSGLSQGIQKVLTKLFGGFSQMATAKERIRDIRLDSELEELLYALKISFDANAKAFG